MNVAQQYQAQIAANNEASEALALLIGSHNLVGGGTVEVSTTFGGVIITDGNGGTVNLTWDQVNSLLPLLNLWAAVLP